MIAYLKRLNENLNRRLDALPERSRMIAVIFLACGPFMVLGMIPGPYWFFGFAWMFLLCHARGYYNDFHDRS